MRHVLAVGAFVGLALFMATGLSRAQDASHTELSVEQIIEKLTPKPGLTLRGFAVSTREVAEKPSINLTIPFEYDSAELTPKAIEMLTVLSRALKSDNLKYRIFRLAGHTDAVGSDAYNQQLSQARAQSAKSYLVTQLGIGENRLDAEGLGESQLLLPNDPENGLNRRVEVTTLN